MPQHVAVSTIATMLVVGLGDPKPACLPSLPSRRTKKIDRPQHQAKKAPKKLVPREFPPCSSDAPTAGPCTPYPRRPSPRCAHEYSVERIGTAPVAIDAVIRRRYGTPRTERRRRPPQAARSCRELPWDPVYAAEAVGGREERLYRHGVRSPARAARVNPFWGIRKLGMKSWKIF